MFYGKIRDMEKNTRGANINNGLDTLDVKTAESGKQLTSRPDKSIADTQKQIAEIIMKDAYKMQMAYPEKDFVEIVDELAQNWKDNIKNFAYAMMFTAEK